MNTKIKLKPIVDFTIAGIIFIILIALLFTGCKHDPILQPGMIATTSTSQPENNPPSYTDNTCDPDSVYFNNDILPLFISNCAKSNCHDAAGHQHGVILNSYSNIISTGDIEAGNPSAGKIMEALTTNELDDRMPPPPAAPLFNSQINLINTWINQGALNNSCSGHCDTTVVTYSGTVAPRMQANCEGCHNSNSAAGNVNLSNYSGVLVVAANGKLFGAINHNAGYAAMPQGGNKLPQCEIDEIRIWVNAGAPNN
jgi:hypothetical protein